MNVFEEELVSVLSTTFLSSIILLFSFVTSILSFIFSLLLIIFDFNSSTGFSLSSASIPVATIDTLILLCILSS